MEKNEAMLYCEQKIIGHRTYTFNRTADDPNEWALIGG